MKFAYSALSFAAAIFVASTALASYDAIVYTVSGGAFDLGVPPGNSYTYYLSELKKLEPNTNVFYMKKHQSHEKEICQELAKLKKENPDAPIILSGHSYGGDASVSIAKCLDEENVQIDLLLTADTVARNALGRKKALTVPDNVVVNFHYYQQNDTMVPGSGYNRREDGTTRGIYNVKQNFGPGPVSGHKAAYRNLISFAIHPKLASWGIHKHSVAQMIEDLKPLNETYFREYPPIPIEQE